MSPSPTRAPAQRQTAARESAAEDPAAMAALAWAHGARFRISAARLAEVPPAACPEIAFVGRSNAGKSTAINTLAGHKRLAFASRTPGRTQLINLFDLGPADAPDATWADLPGYGYAAVERAAKQRWQQVMADYLATRESLVGIVLMVDARHGFTELDRQLLEFVSPRVDDGEVALLVLLTKADKLGRAQRVRAQQAAQAVLAEAGTSEAADVGLTLFSAVDRTGVADVALHLRGWVQAGAAESSTVPPAPAAPTAGR